MKRSIQFERSTNHSVFARFAAHARTAVGRCVGIAILALTATASWAAPAGLFLTDSDLQRLRDTYASSSDADVRTSYALQKGIAEGALDDVADPFSMANISQITYHWCSADTDGIDNSLSDAQRHIEAQSHIMRSLAFQFALTRETVWANKALSLMKAWAQSHTPVNIYDFHPNFQTATIDGMTSEFCSNRPWNFALDAMWQTYGLINVSDAYVLMTRNGYTFSAADDALVRAWILRMAQAVNSSFHAWTKWADLHTGSSAYERYRNDNHLSWSMLGLLAAGVALNDANLKAYVIEGGTWDDQRSGPYANPSSIRKVIDGAIEASGRVYEEKINRDPPIGYSFFHLQPMTLIARVDEVLGGNRVRSFKGADGAGLDAAFTRYAPYVTGTPIAGGEGNLTNYAWLFYFSHRWWPNVAAFTEARQRTPAGQIVKQTAGPVLFMFKGLETAGEVRPMPPVLTVEP
jgi:hypothetical protein